uniref:Uncharacterized protein n=1 Tax=Rhizophora mucronata TaxID=61149 RepID=A0A2P2P7W4_RHIMU
MELFQLQNRWLCIFINFFSL